MKSAPESICITAVALLKGAVPCRAFDDDALAAQILARGATATIADFVDSQSSIGVPLDVMLQECVEKRWSAADVGRWIKDGVRPATLGDRLSEKRCGFVFLDTEHWSAKTLAIALASVADRASVITENLFEARFRFVEEMVRMGVDAETDGHHAKIRGRERLDSATVWASDIRAGAGLVLAGMCGDAVTEVCEIFHIDRGYPDFLEKVRSLGGRIERVDTHR